MLVHAARAGVADAVADELRIVDRAALSDDRSARL
jgi:hypothetical protein